MSIDNYNKEIDDDSSKNKFSQDKINSPILREKIINDLTPNETRWEIFSAKDLETTTSNKLVDLLFFTPSNPNLKQNLTSFIFSDKETIFQFKALIFSDFGIKYDANPTDKTIQDYFEKNGIKQDYKKIERFAEAQTPEEKRKIINDYLENLTASQQQWFRDIKSLALNNQTQNGIYTLYLAPYFLKGKYFEKNIYSPIVLLEIELKFSGSETITIIKKDITFNFKLFLYLEKRYGLLKPNFDLKYKNIVDLVDILKGFFQKKSTEINSKGLSVEKYKPQPVNIDLEQYKPKLTVVQNLVISNYNVRGDSLQLNVLDLITSGEINDVFKPVVESFSNTKEEMSSIVDKEMINLGSRPLNYDQRLSITNALKHDTVIHGPPGTGKSETIASIVANYITRGSNVLVSSQQAAAMEEVYNRLGAVNLLTLPVYSNKFSIIRQNISDLKKLLDKGESAITSPDPIFDTNFSAVSVLMDSIEDVKNVLTKNIKGKNINDLIKSYQNIPPEIYQEIVDKQIPKKIKTLENRSIYSKMKTIEALLDAKEKTIKAYIFLLNNLSKTHFDFIFESIWPNDTNRDLLLEEMEKIKHVNEEWNTASLNKWVSFFSHMIQSKKISSSYSELNTKTVRDVLEKLNLSEDVVKKIFKAIILINNNGDEIPTLVEYKMIYEYKEYIPDIKTIDQWLLTLNKKNMEEILQININAFTNRYIEKVYNSSNENAQKIITKYLLKKYREYQELSPTMKQKVTELFNAVKNDEINVSINYLVRHFFDALKWLFPVWIFSPHQVASLVPLKKDIFEHGIFDEASQMLLERSYPLIYRCKVNVVAGDENQMRPVKKVGFVAKFDQEDIENDFAYDRIESLLGKAQMSNWKNNHFRNHYRATKDTQIYFVNEAIYGKNLNIVSKNVKPYKDLEVLDFTDVNYNETSKVNETEVEATIRLLMTQYKKYKTILVIFPSSRETEFFERVLKDKKLCLELADSNYSISISKARKALPIPKKAKEKLSQKRTKELAKLADTDDFPLVNTFEEIEKVVTTAFNLNQDKLTTLANGFSELKLSLSKAKKEKEKKILLQTFIEQYMLTPEIIEFYLQYESGNDAVGGSLQVGQRVFNEDDYKQVFSKIYPDDSLVIPPIQIKDINNAQGQEADLVIIPFGYVPKTTKTSSEPRLSAKTLTKFSTPGGKNILNVMITRNKDKTIILKSFKAEQIVDSTPKAKPGEEVRENEDLKVFKNYIAYLDNFKQTKSNMFEQEEIKTTGEDAWDPIWVDIVNSIKKSFPEEFTNQLVFKKDFMFGNQLIDFAILNKKEESIKLLLLRNQTLTPTKKPKTNFQELTRANIVDNIFTNVVADDKNKFIVENFRFLDKIEYLQARGYNVHQILDFSYRMNRKNELTKIMTYISIPAPWRKDKK